MTATIEQTQKLLEQRLADFESQLTGIKESPESKRVEVLSRDFYEFKTFAIEMFTLLRKQITELKFTIDELETKNRSDSLLFKGFPEKPGENICQTVIDVIQDKLNITGVTPQSMRSCYRLGRSADGVTRSVLVTFFDNRLRNQVWNNKTKFKGTPFSCSEFLIKSRQMLFAEARKVFGIRNCWTQDGHVIIKLKNGSKRKILHQSDLDALSTLKEPNTGVHSAAAAPSVQQARQKRITTKK